MRELSPLAEILRLAKQHALEYGAGRVREIRLKVNVLSGAEPKLLRRAFLALSVGSQAGGAELIFKVKGLLLACKVCYKESEAKELSMWCPNCGSLHTRVLAGEELLLKTLVLEA
jgi:hydrogenase nickel incorporation protein HypA/HybF